MSGSRPKFEDEALSAVVAMAPDGIFVADGAGRIGDANEAGCRLLGYSLEELRQKHVIEMIPEEQLPRWWKVRERLLLGHVDVGEWIGVRRDGSRVPVEASAKILPDGRWLFVVRDISARRDLEKELQTLAADLNRAQSVAKVGSWRLDVQRNELWWSDETYRMFGLEAGVRLTYETFLACVHPDDRTKVDLAWKAALGGAPYDIEHRILIAGETRWVREKAQLEIGPNAEPLGGVGIVQEITERKRLEEELRLAEATASGIVSTAADAILCLDENQRITVFNRGAEKIFGWSKAEAIGASLDILIPERLRQIHRQHVEQFANSDAVPHPMGDRRRPIVGLKKNGEEFPADASISKFEIDGKRLLTVALRDISEQKRFEDAQALLAEMGVLVGSSLEYEQTLSNIADIIVKNLADVCIVDLAEGDEIRRLKVGCRDREKGPACERLRQLPLGRARPLAAGTVLETREPLLIERVTPEGLASMSGNEEYSSALQALSPQSVISVPLVTRGSLLGALTILSTDPTHLYRASDLQLLEEVARRASLAIENARLYLAARQAIRARDDILGIVAHDLRNPLGAVLMQAQLLRGDRAASDGIRKGAERIERSAKRMNRLIEDLLDIARIEGGNLRIERQETSARGVIADALDSQQTRAAEARVTLASQVPEDLPAVFADRERLLQVFENLVGNALKFTSAGGTVSIAAARRDGEVVFSVRDTGNGISEDQFPHLFERFWQSRGTTRRKGAGLGLAIVKGIVEQHGGSVWAESTPGRGSTFSFSIPVARRSSIPQPRARESRPSAPA